ncbi:MAG: PD-(D/E)XK nuclease family protein, partial [Brevinema sp.]
MQFLLGHFGSGKTTTILEKITELITQKKNFWVIVPSRQHKDEVYRILLQKNHAVIGNPIITLREFQEKILEYLFSNPSERPQTLSNFDQFLIISNIIRKNKKKFKAFKNISSRPKIIQMIYRIIYALRDRNIDDLNYTAHLEDRMHDLKLILNEFDTVLREKNLSDAKFAINIISSMSNSLLKDFFPEHIFIDGFIDFTPNQFKLITSILKQAEKHSVQFLVSFLHINHEICRNTLAQYESVFPLAEKIILENIHPSNNIVDQFLYKTPSTTKTEKIKIHEIQAFGKHREVEEIANQIKKLSLYKEYDLNDILIITKSQDVYAPLFQTVFRKAQIPFQMSKDMILSENSLISFIKKLLSFAEENISHETLDFLAHSNYISQKIRSILMQAPDLLPFAIVGKQKEWEQGFDRLSNINIEITEQTLILKNTINSLCQHLYALDFSKEHPISSFINYISNLMEFLGIEDAFIHPKNSLVQSVIEESLAKDYASLAKLKTIFENMSQSLYQINQESLTIDTFLFYFQMIISETRYRSGIPKQNRIRIVSPEDARGLFIKTVFIIGMNEREFPSPKKFDLFDNQDRTALNHISHKIFGKSLWSTEHEYFSEEKLLFVVALSRASEHIF